MTKPKALKLFDQVERVHHKTLVPAGYNPRRMTKARARQLAASLLKFGLTLPVVAVRATKEIIGGHQRVQRIADLEAWPLTVPASDTYAPDVFDPAATWTLAAVGDVMLDREV